MKTAVEERRRWRREEENEGEDEGESVLWDEKRRGERRSLADGEIRGESSGPQKGTRLTQIGGNYTRPSRLYNIRGLRRVFKSCRNFAPGLAPSCISTSRAGKSESQMQMRARARCRYAYICYRRSDFACSPPQTLARASPPRHALYTIRRARVEIVTMTYTGSWLGHLWHWRWRRACDSPRGASPL